MNSKQRAWVEKHDSNICNVLQDMEPAAAQRVEGMFWCGLVDWDPKRLQDLTSALKAYGKSPEMIESMRAAYREWVIDVRKPVVKDNESGTMAQ